MDWWISLLGIMGSVVIYTELSSLNKSSVDVIDEALELCVVK